MGMEKRTRDRSYELGYMSYEVRARIEKKYSGLFHHVLFIVLTFLSLSSYLLSLPLVEHVPFPHPKVPDEHNPQRDEHRNKVVQMDELHEEVQDHLRPE